MTTTSRPPEQDEERLGCLDLLAASAGMGCALFLRTAVLGLALLLLYLVFHLLGWI